MNKTIIQYLKDVLLLLVIAFAITYTWQSLELIMYKEIQYRKVDDIIAGILLISIYLNIKYYSKIHRIKKLINKIN